MQENTPGYSQILPVGLAGFFSSRTGTLHQHSLRARATTSRGHHDGSSPELRPATTLLGSKSRAAPHPPSPHCPTASGFCHRSEQHAIRLRHSSKLTPSGGGIFIQNGGGTGAIAAAAATSEAARSTNRSATSLSGGGPSGGFGLRALVGLRKSAEGIATLFTAVGTPTADPAAADPAAANPEAFSVASNFCFFRAGPTSSGDASGKAV